METLGSLIDKLVVVQLKTFHTDINARQKHESLSNQDSQLRAEIDEYIANAVAGNIPKDRMTFKNNKVHDGTMAQIVASSSIAGSIATLASVNCDIWHQQEKVYNFAKVPAAMKDEVIHQLAVLNLQRSECIDSINNQFKGLFK